MKRTDEMQGSRLPDVSRADHHKCSAEDCEATHPNHRWGNIKAQSAGWFTQMDGSRWCPDHTPEWVEAWRKSKEKS